MLLEGVVVSDPERRCGCEGSILPFTTAEEASVLPFFYGDLWKFSQFACWDL